MVWVAGADGCRFGWFAVAFETGVGETRFSLVKRAKDLIETDPRPVILALDIPIGLPLIGRRDCDTLAREYLGTPRQSSVFPAPIRPSLRAESREQASAISERIDGRGVSAQSWALYRKVREIDELLQVDAEARSRIYEVHPEVSFWAWNGRHAIAESKKSKTGKQHRLRLAEKWLGGNILWRARGSRLKRELSDDDILDAIAALWTAHRIAMGKHATLPEKPPLDDTGLPMQIVY